MNPRIFSAFLLAIVTLMPGCASTPEDEPTIKGDLEVARQLIESGEYRQAVSQLQSMRRKHPKNASIETYMGQSFLGLGDFKAAGNAFERSLAISSDDDVRLNFAFALTEQKLFAAARKQLDIIEKSGQYPYMEKVHNNYGRSYLEEKRCDLAYPRFAKAILLSPTTVSARYNMGRCQMLEKKYAAAAKSFQGAVDECQGCIEPYLELVRALHFSGQKATAKKKLDTIIMNKLDKETAEKAQKLQQELQKMESVGR